MKKQLTTIYIFHDQTQPIRGLKRIDQALKTTPKQNTLNLTRSINVFQIKNAYGNKRMFYASHHTVFRLGMHDLVLLFDFHAKH